jgi:tetratricopeptide (TPR) repeat protein
MEESIDDETQKFISQSLTDVDLFASYGLTQKAIGLLEAILRRAPQHTPTLEKLLDFVLGAGDDRRTAELAAQLERIHTERGDSAGADRFGELRRRFQRAAGLSDADLLAPRAAATEDSEAGTSVEQEALAASEPPPHVVAASPVSPSAEAQEVDLSDEWSAMLQEAAPAPPAAAKVPPPPRAAADTPAEFEIPIVIDQPSAATTSMEDLSAELAAATPPASAEPQDEPIAISFDEAPAAPHPIPSKAALPPPPPATLEPEFELEQDYELVITPEPLVPAFEQKPPEPPPVAAKPAASLSADQFLADMVSEIDELGIDQLAPASSKPRSAAPAPPPRPPVQPPPPKPLAAPPPSQHSEAGPLKEVFDEFRAELGEMGGEDEDLETHYNLGIAFREMGLLEEAISEFQKVAKATDKGKAFQYAMQCCTLLGLAFMEKGEPSIAAIWYERALHTPGVDAESILALRYDLGVAQESAGDIESARKSFSQVYAGNIDYRDVAERIASLQKPTR